MCGIVGILSCYTNGLAYNEVEAFKNMLMADTLRGSDSTGVFCVENNGNVSIAKEASNGATFLDQSQTSAVMTTAMNSGIFLVGHNRAATRGHIIDSNAHPFWVDDRIVLVQNGTWVGSHTHVKNTAVDTECVAQVIAEHDDVQEALKRINASYALVWYDAKKKELYLLRNKDRPLYMATTKDGSFLFASEPEIIVFGATRAGVELKSKPYMLLEDNLVTVTLKSKSWEVENTKVNTKYSPPKGEAAPTVVQNITKHIQQAIGWTQPTGTAGAKKPSPPTDNLDIHNYVRGAYFGDWHTDERMARQIQNDYATRKEPVYLEMIDYVKADKGKDCKKWHLLFAEISSSKEDPGPLFWATVKDTEEAGVMEMIENPFVVGKVGSPIIHVLSDSTGAKEYITVMRVNEFVKEPEVEDAKILH